jgi:hypothetical protein
LPNFAGRDVRIQQSLPPWCAEQQAAMWVSGMRTVPINKSVPTDFFDRDICCLTRQRRETTW